MAVPVLYIMEQLGSRVYSYEGGKVKATRVFRVWDSANSEQGLLTPSDVRALFGSSHYGPVGVPTDYNTLPALGDLFPDETAIYAHSYSMQRDAGTDQWLVTFNYQNAEVTTGSQPNEAGYVEWSLDVQAAFVDQFVQNPRYPNDGTISTNEANNVINGGTQIDVEGVPLSLLRLTTEISISETVESTGGPPAVYLNSRSARGKRNSASWYGLDKGRVVYMGCNTRRIGVNLYSVQHRLQEATDYHLIQYADRDSTGKIMTALKNGRDRAKTVLWRQPFPSFYDFDSISANW